MHCHFLLIIFLYLLYLRELTVGYVTHNIVKSNSTLYAVKKKKKKSSKYIDITVSSDNEIGTKGEIKKVKLSHAFNYIIPQKLGYRSTINELVDKEKNENTLRYIDDITKSFIWDYKKKLNDLIVPFEFKKNENILVTQDNLLDYLLRRGIIRENDDVYQKIKSKKIKFSNFGAYPLKYAFLDNISINITVQIIESK
ncbi:50S ribosomal protein L9, apicoplast, putative [Plasmodium berghei]|uniref:50S ribosomal protein L9, apicoplast, putative n=2 Tax=Plasmodium berghei TaxID=5821 RepID=A0A509AE14_PLABA|nr:50S ribosomal protein L9, apicoplast, putative [Plasmodium berghei ANKA]CXI01482.1 50S ribosomal protein L9, apicoplast, putative [Plasmodium berghei]SCM15540.1 50S ribosomal protein L9, apicoplast, putative [Plasmodium berghei]SCM17332.1 50S ribosomal protein L9, apicoplast, putative [Plasmodium berghei]VUC54305.1 50S ribosomal protein L9, apicoplast, putative [Plasmodium berghei ANKA]|eukprot:XP_034420138.1 50S ribosomal protein L9, apicoplast, putative [Plasmodium berghei ANKA]